MAKRKRGRPRQKPFGFKFSDEKTKAILYARFSPRKNPDESISIEYQMYEMREYARNHDWEVAGEYSDEAFSGDDVDRPGLWAALDSLNRGYVLLVHRLDRLARDVYLSNDIDRTVENRQAKIVSMGGEGTWQDTDEGKLIRHILHALAEYEKRKISARTKAAMLRHQKNGRRMSANIPYGYMPDPDSPMHRSGKGRTNIIRNPVEQSIIADVMEMHRLGATNTEIARNLQERGEPTRTGSPWHHHAVCRIIHRELSE